MNYQPGLIVCTILKTKLIASNNRDIYILEMPSILSLFLCCCLNNSGVKGILCLNNSGVKGILSLPILYNEHVARYSAPIKSRAVIILRSSCRARVLYISIYLPDNNVRVYSFLYQPA